MGRYEPFGGFSWARLLFVVFPGVFNIVRGWYNIAFVGLVWCFCFGVVIMGRLYG